MEELSLFRTDPSRDLGESLSTMGFPENPCWKKRNNEEKMFPVGYSDTLTTKPQCSHMQEGTDLG